MKKERKLYGLLNHKKSCYNTVCILLLLMLTSCGSNKYALKSSEIEYIHFWFVGDIDTSIAIQDCEDILRMQDHHDTIITDRKVIERYVSIINHTKSIPPNSNYDLRVSSLIKMKLINDERKPAMRVCIGNYGQRVLIDGLLMKGNHKKIWSFVQEILYSPLTPYDWLPDYMKQYIKENPKERSKFLPEE